MNLYLQVGIIESNIANWKAVITDQCHLFFVNPELGVITGLCHLFSVLFIQYF